MTNTSGKVTVSREVAEAIEYSLSETKAELVVEWFVKGYSAAPEVVVLQKLPIDTLIRALYIGYEVKKSPEEELAEFIAEREYRSQNDSMETLRYRWASEARGARKAAEILGVKLPEPTRKD